MFISTPDAEAADKARRIIEGIAKDIEVGEVYTGKVVRIMNFGAFVELLPGKDGMIHISKLANHRVEKVEDVVKIGDTLEVKVAEPRAQRHHLRQHRRGCPASCGRLPCASSAPGWSELIAFPTTFRRMNAIRLNDFCIIG